LPFVSIDVKALVASAGSAVLGMLESKRYEKRRTGYFNGREQRYFTVDYRDRKKKRLL